MRQEETLPLEFESLVDAELIYRVRPILLKNSIITSDDFFIQTTKFEKFVFNQKHAALCHL